MIAMGVRDLQQGDSPRRFVPLRKIEIPSKQLRQGQCPQLKLIELQRVFLRRHGNSSFLAPFSLEQTSSPPDNVRPFESLSAQSQYFSLGARGDRSLGVNEAAVKVSPIGSARTGALYH
jgi:hypothetical protein